MTRTHVLAVLGAVVLVGAVIVTAGGKLPWTGGSPAQSCDIPERVTASPPAASAPGGGGVRVAEQGFTQSPGSGMVSLGAVLENTSGQVAYRTPVTFRLFDSGHAPAGEQTVEVPILLPGQRVGAGAGTYGRAATMEAGVGPVTWLSRDALGGFTPFAAGYLRTLRFYPDNPASVDVHYHETSANCRDLTSRGTAVVFRDHAGRIVGGANGSPDTPIVFRDARGRDLGGDWRRPASPSCARGDRETWVVPYVGAPATADDARTEVHPYCDLRPE